MQSYITCACELPHFVFILFVKLIIHLFLIIFCRHVNGGRIFILCRLYFYFIPFSRAYYIFILFFRFKCAFLCKCVGSLRKILFTNISLAHVSYFSSSTNIFFFVRHFVLVFSKHDSPCLFLFLSLSVSLSLSPYFAYHTHYVTLHLKIITIRMYWTDDENSRRSFVVKRLKYHLKIPSFELIFFIPAQTLVHHGKNPIFGFKNSFQYLIEN